MESSSEGIEARGLPESTQVLRISQGKTDWLHAYALYISLSLLQKFLVAEEERAAAPRPKIDIQSLSTRAYLDHTVVPILLDAMATVAKER